METKCLYCKSNMLQCVAVCCSVLQCVAVCCKKERDGDEVFVSANANKTSESAHVCVYVYVCNTLQHTTIH